MTGLRRICVFCGSSPGGSPRYREAATELAEALYEEGCGLVYGGASKGLMGALADRMLELDGEVIGVIPQSLKDKEIAHKGLSKLHVVDSMHERKSMMAMLSDGFIALPGGTGTLEEIIESVTWGQLQFHNKPCGLLNVEGYFNHLLAFLDHAMAQQFLRPPHRAILQVAESAPRLLIKMRAYEAPILSKWVD